MNYGFVRACAATVPIRVADVEFNTEQIINAIKLSAEKGSRLTVLPELCITGYTCGDLFNQQILIEKVETALGKIQSETKGIKSLVFVGAPLIHCGKLFNCRRFYPKLSCCTDFRG